MYYMKNLTRFYRNNFVFLLILQKHCVFNNFDVCILRNSKWWLLHYSFIKILYNMGSKLEQGMCL